MFETRGLHFGRGFLLISINAIEGTDGKIRGCNLQGETDHMKWCNVFNRRAFIFGILGAGSFIATATLLPWSASAQMSDMEKVHASMAALKAKTATLGPPKIEGTQAVGGKEAPALYFGTTKMNNDFDVVDEVVKENGGTATLFVKSGDEYVRVATTVRKDNGSRAIGTILDPKGPVIKVIRKGEAYYGDAMILGKPYITGYDPIRDTSGGVIGIYYVGYSKG
jgi:hypothetical protein